MANAKWLLEKAGYKGLGIRSVNRRDELLPNLADPVMAYGAADDRAREAAAPPSRLETTPEDEADAKDLRW